MNRAAMGGRTRGRATPDVGPRLSSHRPGGGHFCPPPSCVRQSLPACRQILRKLVVGRIGFLRRDDGVYEFSGQASLGRMVSGVICTKTVVAPTGFEPVVKP